MNEQSKTLIVGAAIQPKHVESGVEPLSFEDECRQAAQEAAKQSTNQSPRYYAVPPGTSADTIAALEACGMVPLPEDVNLARCLKMCPSKE